MHKYKTMEDCIRYRHLKGTAQHVIKSAAAESTGKTIVILYTTARARCVFVHVAASVRLPSPRALRRNAYINTTGQLVHKGWRGGAMVGRRTRDQEVASSIPGRARLRNDSGQVVHTQLPRR